jgi:CheY-like chemotaxis protein
MADCIAIQAKTVLVVEDEPLLRRMAVSLTEEEGFTVLQAPNADAAIAILERHPEIRVVFTDIHMNGSMDGLGLVAFAHHRWPPLRFLVVSGEHRPAHDDLPEGACFFAKPYHGASIARALHSLA